MADGVTYMDFNDASVGEDVKLAALAYANAELEKAGYHTKDEAKVYLASLLCNGFIAGFCHGMATKHDGTADTGFHEVDAVRVRQMASGGEKKD